MVAYTFQVPNMMFSLQAPSETVNLPALITLKIRIVVPTTLLFFPLQTDFFFL